MADKLGQAIKFIKSGDRAYGKNLLTEILETDPENETAWLWMSAVVDTDGQRRECLKEVLKFNPNNQAAKRGLEKLEQNQSMVTAAQPEETKVVPVEIPGMESLADFSFKFRYVRNGQATGLISQKGVASGHQVVLGQESLSYDGIVSTIVRDNRLLLSVSPTAQLGKKLSKALVDETVIPIELNNKTAAEDLGRYIDRVCSRRKAEANKQRLFRAGKGDLFRFAVCPECKAIIDLSELDKTHYIYCCFCETVFAQDQEVITQGTIYRICDECGMFDRVRGYTEFYFYFLLVVYGFSINRRHVCDNCADSIFRKTFFLNLLFLLGIPSSIYLKIKSLAGRDPFFKELAKANSLARKGRSAEAAPIFGRLHSRYPEHPGLLVDEGVGYLVGNDAENALERLRRALKACSNYLPAHQLMDRAWDAQQLAGG